MKIKLIGGAKLSHEGKLYKDGETVELGETQAEEMCKLYPQWFVLATDKPAQPKEVAK